MLEILFIGVLWEMIHIQKASRREEELKSSPDLVRQEITRLLTCTESELRLPARRLEALVEERMQEIVRLIEMVRDPILASQLQRELSAQLNGMPVSVRWRTT